MSDQRHNENDFYKQFAGIQINHGPKKIQKFPSPSRFLDKNYKKSI
jgi:hypothetical protein